MQDRHQHTTTHHNTTQHHTETMQHTTDTIPTRLHRCKQVAEIKGALNKAREAGIQNILALRGDPSKGEPRFPANVPEKHERLGRWLYLAGGVCRSQFFKRGQI